MLCSPRRFIACQRLAGFWLAVFMAALASLASLWHLPPILASDAASAYVCVYISALVLMGWPLLSAELLLARGQRADLVGVISRASAPLSSRWPWMSVGVLMWVGAFLLVSILLVLGSWSLAYAVRALAGHLVLSPADGAASQFERFARDAERGLGWLLLMCGGLVAVLAGGIRKAVLPVLAGIAGILIFWVVIVLGIHAADGVSARAWHALGQPPRFAALGVTGASAAVYQALMSLGMGSGVVMTLGSRMPRQMSVFRLAAGVVITSTGLSLAMAWAIGSALDQNQLAALAGFQALFTVLPTGLGRWGSFGVYAITTLIVLAVSAGLAESLVCAGESRLRWRRSTASLVVGGLLAAAAVLVQNGLGGFAGVALDGPSLMTWCIRAAGNILFPVAALALGVLAARAIPKQRLRDLWDPRVGSLRRAGFGVWHVMLCYPARLLLLVAVFHAWGGNRVIDWLW